MLGMDAATGRRLSGIAHVEQSIADILMTPIGSRAMRRDYGSHLFALIDQPGNRANRLRCYAAVVDALLRWEPRVLPVRIVMNMASEMASGAFEIGLDVVLAGSVEGFEAGTGVSLSIPLFSRHD